MIKVPEVILIIGALCMFAIGFAVGIGWLPDCPESVVVNCDTAYTTGFHVGECEGFRFAESSYLGFWDSCQIMVEAERLTSLAYLPYVPNCADSIATLNERLELLEKHRPIRGSGFRYSPHHAIHFDSNYFYDPCADMVSVAAVDWFLLEHHDVQRLIAADPDGNITDTLVTDTTILGFRYCDWQDFIVALQIKSKDEISEDKR